MKIEGKIKFILLVPLFAACTRGEKVRVYGVPPAPAAEVFAGEGLTAEAADAVPEMDAAGMLARGDLDAAVLTFASPLFRIEKFFRAAAVVAEGPAHGWTMMARADVAENKNLRGRSIGISRRAGSVEGLALKRYLAASGLTELDVRYVYMKPSEIVFGFRHGSLDAGILPSPFVTAAAAHADKLAEAGGLVEGLVSSVLVFNRAFISDKPDLALRLLQTYLRHVPPAGQVEERLDRTVKAFAREGWLARVPDTSFYWKALN